MSVLWVDGFDGYGAIGDAVRDDTMKVRYDAVSLFPSVASGSSIVAGSVGGRALAIKGSAAGNFFVTPPIASDDEIIVGFRFKLEAYPSSAHKMVLVYSETGTEMCYLGVSTTGTLTVLASLSGTGFSGASTATLSLSTWHYVEFRVKFHASAGESEVKLDGVTIHSQTGIDTVVLGGGTTWSAASFVAPILVGVSWYVDDYYICDGNGTSANTFLGDCRVITLIPDADATPNDFTPSSGTNHYAVLNNPAHSESSYVQGDTGEELFTHENLVSGGTIFGVCHSILAMKTEPIAPDIRLKCVSGATTDTATTEKLSAGTFGHQRILETDPNTGLAWEVADVNAAKFGLEAV